ncbi:MAG: T9SS type A sorting domain-containing protein [Lewinellaceae bacterium]|nr:T9SS type A sorting domain-containing protein [Lewinellaceae bacterium]
MRIQIFFSLLFATLAITGFSQALSGNYTIDKNLPTGGVNFQSFGDFAASLNANGVSGDVVATVEPGSGPYQEQVVFSNIAGTGPNATITLEGSGEVITALTNTDNRHVVRLANCQYFTINNLHVAWDPTSTSGFYGIHIYQTGNHITISNCNVDMSGATSTLIGAYIASGSTISILEGGDFHDILITQNVSTGGGYGASVFGLASPLATNIEISNNEFYSAHSNSVYIRETDGVHIHHNFIDKLTSQVTSWNAIQIAQNANINADIHDNYIQISQTANGTAPTVRGIYLFNGTGHKVYNNVITNIQMQSSDFTAIEVRTGATAPEIYFNTISIDNPENTSGDLAGIKESLTNTNSILRNNVISMSQPCTGLKSGLVLATNSNPAVAFDSDYNDIYVPGGNVAQKGSLTTIVTYPTLSQWQSVSGQDGNSYDLDPGFLSPLQPQPTNQNLNNKGIQISGITIDFLGINRNNPPDMGAYEFGGCPPPSAPAQVFGETELCINTSGAVYSIDPVTGATGYTWTVPNGASITSGQGTTTISVDFGTQSGNIGVAVEDTCGLGAPALLPVSLITAPATPGPITGPGAVCEGTPSVTYTVSNVPGATTYTWTVPSGVTIQSGQGSNIIILQIGEADPSSGTISVVAQNDCGSSAPSNYTLLVYPPTTVTLNIPQDTVCLNAAPFALTGGDPVDGEYSGPGVDAGMFDPMAAGLGAHTITLTYQDEFGCTYSDTDVIVVDACTGTKEAAAPNVGWTLYPNPTTGIAKIRGLGTVIPRIRVYNRLGRMLLEKEGLDLDLSAYPAGLYLIEVNTGLETSVKRLILQK